MSVEVTCGEPALRAWLVELLRVPPFAAARHHYRIDKDGLSYCLRTGTTTLASAPQWGEIYNDLMHRVCAHYVADYTLGPAIHAGCVSRDGVGFLIPGNSGAGKTTLTAWLLRQGFDYVTDELVLMRGDALSGWARPLHVKLGSLPQVSCWATWQHPGNRFAYEFGAYMLATALGAKIVKSTHARVVLLPHYQAGARTQVVEISRAQVVPRIWRSVVNVTHLHQGGFAHIAALARGVRAFALTYGEVETLAPELECLGLLGSTHAVAPV